MSDLDPRGRGPHRGHEVQNACSAAAGIDSTLERVNAEGAAGTGDGPLASSSPPTSTSRRSAALQAEAEADAEPRGRRRWLVISSGSPSASNGPEAEMITGMLANAGIRTSGRQHSSVPTSWPAARASCSCGPRTTRALELVESHLAPPSRG